MFHANTKILGSTCLAFYNYNDSVDGGWGDWTTYSNCDVTCGDGMKTRTRTCNNPSASNGGLSCPGQNSQTAPCYEQQCAGTGEFTTKNKIHL